MGCVNAKRSALVAALVLSASTGCEGERDVRAIVDAAIAAHGGRARIDALESVTVRGTGRFRARTSLRATVVYASPSRWCVDAESDSGVTMRFGFDGERCWREDRHLVRACNDGDRAGYAIFAEVLGARLGRGLDASRFVMADDVVLDGRPAPALRAGELVYVFHPETHRVAQIRYGDAVEALGGYERVAGVLVATRRVLTIGGELDVQDQWDEIVPSGSAPRGLRAPAPPGDGTIIDYVDPERWVVWTEVDSLERDQAVGSLEALARSRAHPISASDGLVLTPLDAPGGHGRWRIAITVETGQPAVVGAMHVERWPAQRWAGLFHAGDPRSALSRAPTLQRWMDAHGLAPRDDARWQVLAPDERQAGASGELSLLRIAVE